LPGDDCDLVHGFGRHRAATRKSIALAALGGPRRTNGLAAASLAASARQGENGMKAE
jgi:hypothetical protein